MHEKIVWKITDYRKEKKMYKLDLLMCCAFNHNIQKTSEYIVSELNASQVYAIMSRRGGSTH